jgi:hypothetical protein
MSSLLDTHTHGGGNAIYNPFTWISLTGNYASVGWKSMEIKPHIGWAGGGSRFLTLAPRAPNLVSFLVCKKKWDYIFCL